MARRNHRNCAAGAWLSVFPNRLNGTGLSADEWRDNVRLRYNHSPQDMPTACDGCGARMTVEHALSCKTGGLVHILHDGMEALVRHCILPRSWHLALTHPHPLMHKLQSAWHMESLRETLGRVPVDHLPSTHRNNSL